MQFLLNNFQLIIICLLYLSLCIILCILIYVIFYKYKYKFSFTLQQSIEQYININNNNAICLITLNPNKIWCNFLNTFTSYKIFIIVDDNNFDLSDYESKYTNINFIKVDNELCKLAGYTDVNLEVKKLISGWDKALYYFGIQNNNKYEFVWFIEDDVFFCNENTIIQIDMHYPNSDLLSNGYGESDGNKNIWKWNSIDIINYSPPYYSGMMCAVRMSIKMLNCINNYATLNGKLFFLEALFPTLSIKNNLLYDIPQELNEIHYRYEFDNVNCNTLYHPIKDLNRHNSLRT